MRAWPACVLGLLCAAPRSAQELALRSWSVRDGLVQSRVNDIRRDASGYLWFATWEGVSRFDGRHFESWGPREGLPNPLVWGLAEDRAGRMWLGTHGGGLARVADVGHAVLSAPIGPRNPARYVYALAFDQDERLWLVTDQGLYASEPAPPEARSFVRREEFGPAWFGRPFVDERARLWLVAPDELVRCDGAELARFPIVAEEAPEEPRDPGERGELRAVAARRAGGCWVAHVRSLHVLELPADDAGGAGGRAALERRVPIDFGPNTSLYDVCEDDRGRLWVATSRGLLCREGEDERWLRAAQGLPDDWIHSLAWDDRGGLWLGTHHGGAAFVPDSRVERYTQQSGLGDGNAVKLVAQDAERWIVSTEVAGVFELAGGRARRIEGSERPPFDRIQHDLARDGAGDWWIGTSAGIWRARGPELALASAELQGEAQGLPPGASFVLGLDPAGRVLVSGPDGRFFARAPGVAGRFEPLPFELPAQARGERCLLAFDPRGGAWIAAKEGLWRLGEGGLAAIDPWPDEELTAQPRALLLDSRGWLWVGTRFGGVAWTRAPSDERPVFEVLTTREGLASDTVFALAEDRDGSLWLGTGRGVHRYRPESRESSRQPFDGTLEHLGPDDGLAGEWVTDLALDARGDLWVAAAGGVSHLCASEPRPPRTPPRVRFTRCVVAGSELELPSAGALELPALAIGAADSRLSFEYVAVDPVDGPRLRYRTRLEGLDAAWSAPTRELSARYGQLAPGSYRLAVRAIDPKSGAEGPVASVALVVLPPLWARGWFLALALLAAGALAWSAHRLHLRRALALERVRTAIASDLHDDLGAGLAQIAISSERARRASGPEASLLMGEVAGVARDLRGSLSDLVWAVDPRRDTLAEVVGRMRHFATGVLADGPLLDFRAPEPAELAPLRIAPDRRRHLFLLYKEALTNVARHARAAHVSVVLALSGRRLRLAIVDDGRGFDPAARHAGQGLASLRRRAHELEAALAIDSAPGRGTRVELQLEL